MDGGKAASAMTQQQIEELPALLSVSDVACLLDVRGSTVRAWLRAGQIPGTQIGRRWFVPTVQLRSLFGW